MHHTAPKAVVRCALACLCFSPMLALAQTTTVNNDVVSVASRTSGSIVTLTGKAEFHVTNTGDPIPSCTINLNSQDAWFFMDSIEPATVISTFLSRVRVNGATAVNGTNVRVAQYASGAVVIPHAPAFAAMQVFNGQNLTGSSTSLVPYTRYNATELGTFADTIRSFRLKRGYTATISSNADGGGYSRNYVAADGDLEITLLPSTLDNAVSFVRIFPWRWTPKKGVAGNITDVDAKWWYNWNTDGASDPDFEYVGHRAERYWPGILSQDWQAKGVDQLLGYNEPDSASQSNIAVADAVWSWPDLLYTGLRVGAPAVTDGGVSSWLYPFMTQTAAENKRVDFVAVHYYRGYSNAANPTGAANQFYNFLLGIYNTTKKPIWITEWNNGANWVAEPDPTFEQQAATIDAMLTMLENAHFVERYSIYSWVEEVRQLHYNAGGLTPAGVIYRDRVSKIGYLQEMPDPGTTGLARYPFDSDARDASGNGHDTMSVGNPSYVTGQVGNAISLDGTNDHLVVSPTLGDSTDFTFAGWVYRNSTAAGQRVFDFGDGSLRYMYLTPRDASSLIRFEIKNGSTTQSLTAAAPTTGVWTHIAVTISGDTGKLFVNGALVATNAAMTLNPIDLGTRLNYIGKSQLTDPRYNGRLDDLRFYPTALSDSEVAALTLLSPWATSDIGAVGANGSASQNAGTFTVLGSGDNIFGTADEFRYVYMPASGDCQITARVDSISASNTWAKGGVMIRESLAANSRHALLAATPGGTLQFIRRADTGGTSVTTDTASLAAPRWVRLTRAGSTITAAHSTNGTTWTTVGSQSITMGTNIYIGLAVSARTDGQICTVTASNVTGTP